MTHKKIASVPSGGTSPTCVVVIAGTLRGARLLYPELVFKWGEDTVQFRGHLLNADIGEVV